MAGVTRPKAKAFVLGEFSKKFHRPASHFSEDDDLRDDLLFTDASLRQFGKRFNGWQGITIKPSEILACVTIKDIIDLVWSKAK